jgi:hypothetical protein
VPANPVTELAIFAAELSISTALSFSHYSFYILSYDASLRGRTKSVIRFNLSRFSAAQVIGRARGHQSTLKQLYL